MTRSRLPRSHVALKWYFPRLLHNASTRSQQRSNTSFEVVSGADNLIIYHNGRSCNENAGKACPRRGLEQPRQCIAPLRKEAQAREWKHPKRATGQEGQRAVEIESAWAESVRKHAGADDPGHRSPEDKEHREGPAMDTTTPTSGLQRVNLEGCLPAD